jgi:hypothetical protein
MGNPKRTADRSRTSNIRKANDELKVDWTSGFARVAAINVVNT